MQRGGFFLFFLDFFFLGEKKSSKRLAVLAPSFSSFFVGLLVAESCRPPLRIVPGDFVKTYQVQIGSS